jgi:uncharacterized protein (DUF305 family)
MEAAAARTRTARSRTPPARLFTGSLVRLPAGLLAMALAGGCAAATPATPTGPGTTGRTAAVPSAAAVTAPGGFGPTDVAWVELMIPMDTQALRLLAMVPGKVSDPEVKRLAARISAYHRSELVKLRELLLRSGVPQTDPHQGHTMPGMVTPDELAAIGRASGAAFDRLVTEHLHEHLKQSILVARGEQDSGVQHDTKALAAAIEKTRAGQLAELDRLGP